MRYYSMNEPLRDVLVLQNEPSSLRVRAEAHAVEAQAIRNGRDQNTPCITVNNSINSSVDFDSTC